MDDNIGNGGEDTAKTAKFANFWYGIINKMVDFELVGFSFSARIKVEQVPVPAHIFTSYFLLIKMNDIVGGIVLIIAIAGIYF